MKTDQAVVLASNNQGKLNEFEHLLAPLGWTVHAQRTLGIGDADETGSTFVENALIKAKHASAIAGLPAIADDSGLVVPALNGAPGIYSARYGGTHGDDALNNQTLIENMQSIEDRRAYFYCAMVYLRHAEDPVPLIATAAWHGQITHSAEGVDGFGYDPYFFVEELGKTSAQLPRETKNTLSHRGQATRGLLAQIEQMHAHA